MFRKLSGRSGVLLILGMICLLLSEVRCGNFQQKSPPVPQKTVDRQLASVPAGSAPSPDAAETGVLPDAVSRIKRFLSDLAKG